MNNKAHTYVSHTNMSVTDPRLFKRGDDCQLFDNQNNAIIRRELTREFLSPVIKKDMTIYPNLMSLPSAIEQCPCTKCMDSLIPCRQMVENDVYGIPKRRRVCLISTLRSSKGPTYPDFTDEKSRVESLVTAVAPETIGKLAAAGFFYRGQSVLLSCFECGLCLDKDILLNDPLREHARWNPVCQFLKTKVADDFIHNVLQDTKTLKRFYKNYDRPTEIITDCIVEAQKTYPPDVIVQTLSDFFLNVGSYPWPIEFFSILKLKKAWKTDLR